MDGRPSPTPGPGRFGTHERSAPRRRRCLRNRRGTSRMQCLPCAVAPQSRAFCSRWQPRRRRTCRPVGLGPASTLRGFSAWVHEDEDAVGEDPNSRAPRARELPSDVPFERGLRMSHERSEPRRRFQALGDGERPTPSSSRCPSRRAQHDLACWGRGQSAEAGRVTEDDPAVCEGRWLVVRTSL